MCAAICAAVAAILFLAQSGAASGGPAPGSWELGSGSVAVTETNDTGQTLLRAYVVLPAGVEVTGGASISAPPALCTPREPAPAIANEIQCNFAPYGWQNGTSITFSFPVSDPHGELSTNPPPTLQSWISYVNEARYLGPFELPFGTAPAPTPAPGTPAPTPETAKPCACVTLAGTLSRFHTFGRRSTRIQFDVDWEMRCTSGDGNCNGELAVYAPPGTGFLESNGEQTGDEPSVVHVSCLGPCAKTMKGSTTLSYEALAQVKGRKHGGHTLPVSGFLPSGRAGRSFEIRVNGICASKRVSVKKLELSFDKHGQVDYRSSHLRF